MLNREKMLKLAQDTSIVWDFVVIGGGATGLGIALDAASRGFKTLLVEQSDFAKSSSSKSTKLIHGGLRYLRMGDLALVREGLQERSYLLKSAPHIVYPLKFLVPHYDFWEPLICQAGLKLYDFLAGQKSIERSKWVSKQQAILEIPTLQVKKLRNASVYYDASFDDARLAVILAQTAFDEGASLINYVQAKAFEKKDGKIVSLVLEDLETKQTFNVKGHNFINATGPFCDFVRKIDDPKSTNIINPSQGVHIVLPSYFCPGETALLIPNTKDGRLVFCIPWQGVVLVGTTDSPIDEVVLDPIAKESEIEFLLESIKNYLTIVPKKQDILSVFTGIRPLVKNQEKPQSKLSRNHKIFRSPSGLISVAGGKWTTFRKMAQDVVDFSLKNSDLKTKDCRTLKIKLYGYTKKKKNELQFPQFGLDSSYLENLIAKNPGLAQNIHKDLPIKKAQIVYAISHEMARTVEDVLARRTRCLFINAKASIECAQLIAKMLSKQLGKDKNWEDRQTLDFINVANTFLVNGVIHD